MPRTRVVLYQEEDGSCPFLKWFNESPARVQDKCYLRLERLREMGHELRRPEADFLREVSHGLVKERVVPAREIDRAVERKKRFEAKPARHTYEEA